MTESGKGGQHWKDCDCLTCRFPYMKEFVRRDELGLELLSAHLSVLQRMDTDTVHRKGYWASATLFPCLRKEWLLFHEAEPTNHDANQTIFKLGEDIEEEIVDEYKRAGSLIKTQKYIEVRDPRLRLPITGKIDLLIAEEGVPVPVEVKSAKDFSENYGYDLWTKLLPKTEHVAQLMVYLKATGLPRGYVHYRNKNRGIDARYEVVFSQQFYDEIVARFVELETELPKQEPPIPKGFSEGSYPCGWYSKDRKKEERIGSCAFYSHCWGEQMPVKLRVEDFRWSS